MVSNKIKYLEVSLPTQIIDMYLNDKTIKSLKKEIYVNIRGWLSYISRINIVQMVNEQK